MQLRVINSRSASIEALISIPEGAIERFCDDAFGTSLGLFQYPRVQLRAPHTGTAQHLPPISIPEGAIESRVLLVLMYSYLHFNTRGCN